MTKPLLARLDDLARLTGIPAFAEGRPRRRRVRALSTGALLAAGAGGAMVAFGAPPPGGATTLGLSYLLLFAGLAISNVLPLFGPVKPWGGAEPVDERDRHVRARAYLGAIMLLAGTAIVGLFALAYGSMLHGWPAAHLQAALIMLALLLQAIFMAGPACFASWAERGGAEFDGG